MLRHALHAAILSSALALCALPARAAGTMTEQQARLAAAKILKGDPYGNTTAQIMRNIEAAQLITAGASDCGEKVTKPVWQFRVFVPKSRNPSGDNDIKGYLVIDGATGKLICAGLPFLD